MATLFLNSDEVVKFTNKLEQLSHTAMPNIVRATLNAAALDVKQKTMPIQSNVFKHREPNFFKANSKVEFAKKTHNINDMQSSVGFSESKLKQSGFTNNAVKELEQQEHGGVIGHRTYVPLLAARKGNTNDGLIEPKYRLSKLYPKIKFASEYEGKNAKEKFIKAAVAAGVGGFVVGSGLDSTFLFQVTKINRLQSGLQQPMSVGQARRKPGFTNVETKKLYSVKAYRSVKVHETDFMAKASFETERKLEGIYITLAKARIEKELK